MEVLENLVYQVDCILDTKRRCRASNFQFEPWQSRSDSYSLWEYDLSATSSEVRC